MVYVTYFFHCHFRIKRLTSSIHEEKRRRKKEKQEKEKRKKKQEKKSKKKKAMKKEALEVHCYNMLQTPNVAAR